MAIPYVPQLLDCLLSCQRQCPSLSCLFPSCCVENSGPFRAFLGAVLSVLKDVLVQTIVSNPNMELGIIPGEEDNRPSLEDGIDHSQEFGLIVCPIRGRFQSVGSLINSQITSSSPHCPEYSRVRVCLHPLPNNTFLPPLCTENGNGEQHLSLTHLIPGFGSTGRVQECHFDNSDGLFGISVVELLRSSDVERQKRFCNEFEVHLTPYLGDGVPIWTTTCSHHSTLP